MRRPVGVSIGATLGNSAEADGRTGIAVPCRRRHRCLSISANMQAIDIRASSSSTRFKASITPTNRATPSCSSTTRRSEHRVRPRDLRRQTKECLTREPPQRRKADRLQRSNALQADPRRKKEVATLRGPPPHQRLPSLARPQPSLRASSRIRRGPSAMIRRRGQKVRTKGRKTRGQRRTQSKVARFGSKLTADDSAAVGSETRSNA